MLNFLDIINSWIDSYNPTKEQLDLVNERKEICNTCDNLKYMSIFDIYICDLCKCPINKKIFSKEKCEKWKK